MVKRKLRVYCEEEVLRAQASPLGTRAYAEQTGYTSNQVRRMRSIDMSKYEAVSISKSDAEVIVNVLKNDGYHAVAEAFPHIPGPILGRVASGQVYPDIRIDKRSHILLAGLRKSLLCQAWGPQLKPDAVRQAASANSLM